MPPTAQVDRIEIFIARIKAIPKREIASLRATCIAEIGYLKSPTRMAGYEDRRLTKGAKKRDGFELTTVRRAISRYRNAIREQLGENHPALTYMRLKDDDQEAYNDEARKTVIKRLVRRRPLEADRHIERARYVLDRYATAAPLELTAAIIAVTGRRPLETLQDQTPEGDFRPVKTPDPSLFDPSIPVNERWTILFAGQRKTRDAESAQTQPYQIPVLVEPALILRAVKELRKRYDCQGLTPDEVGNRAWKNLGKYAKGEYASQLLERGYRDRDDNTINPMELRKAYAACAWHLFAPRRFSINPYYARTLGHSENDVLTSFSYDVFYIWGGSKEHARAAHAGALETLHFLEGKQAAATDDTIRDRIGADIDTVKQRLEDL